VDPQVIDDIGEFAVHVAHAIGDDPARIDQLVSERAERRYVVINKMLTDEQLDAVEKLDLPGLAVEPVPVRHYPQGEVAGQLVGFVGTEHKGLDGIEYILDPALQGEHGEIRTLRDARRRPLWIERSAFKPAVDGLDARLSLDVVVQAITERELAKTCEKYQAKRGQVVVMNPMNGQLLAMANWPLFDPNKDNRTDFAGRRNACITDAYEPGSVFKPFVHAYATDKGLASGGTLVDTTTAGVWRTPYRRVLHDAHGHGLVTWDKVLVVSSNIGMAKIAEQLGAKRMHAAVESFGFGSVTGTGLPGESPGILIDAKDWTKYSLSSVPMGQEIAVTPVQLAKGLSAIANGGLVVAPTILADEAEAPIFRRAISKKVADHTRQVMGRVVSAEGTGRNAVSDLYSIWGKTGTAQVPGPGGYKHRTYASSFICGAPLRDPKLVVIVAIHEPNPDIGYYGGVVAAPLAKEVVEQVLSYMGVAPDVQNEDELAEPRRFFATTD
jgi:cell division protein FtsI/penicillin-binding protein 2